VNCLLLLPGSNRIAERPEFARALLSASARESVERVGDLDVNEACTRDHRLPPRTRQGACDSTSPEIDVAQSLLRHGALNTDVRHRHAPARPQHAEDLSVHPDLVRA